MSGAEGQSPGIGRERQFEIDVGGARGTHSDVPVSLERLERAARRAITPEGIAYVAGGAGAEETIRADRAAVGLGRPCVWGLAAAAGQEGVREVVRNLSADFDLTLGLAGHGSVAEMGRESVSREG